MADNDVLVSMRIGFKVHKYRNAYSNPDWTPLLSDFGKSNTDKSTYRPDISLARAQAGMSSKTLVYDFSDGKDTGETAQTYIRQPGLDVTEVDSAIQRLNDNFDSKVKEDLESQKRRAKDKKIDDFLDKSLSDSSSSSSPDSSSTAGASQ